MLETLDKLIKRMGAMAPDEPEHTYSPSIDTLGYNMVQCMCGVRTIDIERGGGMSTGQMKEYKCKITQLDDSFHWEVYYAGTGIVEAVEDTLEEMEKVAQMVLDLFRQSYEGAV